MSDETLFSEAGISITKTMLESPGKSLAIAHVAGVSKYVNIPDKKLPIILIVAGVLTIWIIGLGLIPLIIGIVLLVSNKKTYSVRLAASSGQTDWFSSKDEAQIDRIVAAVQQAIRARG